MTADQLANACRNDFLTNLRGILARRKLSAADFAAQIGMSPPQFSDLMRRRNYPTLLTICRISLVLDVPPHKLLAPAKKISSRA